MPLLVSSHYSLVFEDHEAQVTETGSESPALSSRGRMSVPCLGLGMRGIRWIIPSQECIDSASYQFCYGYSLALSPSPKPL